MQAMRHSRLLLSARPAQSSELPLSFSGRLIKVFQRRVARAFAATDISKDIACWHDVDGLAPGANHESYG